MLLRHFFLNFFSLSKFKWWGNPRQTGGGNRDEEAPKSQTNLKLT